MQRGLAPLHTTKFQAFSCNIVGLGAGESPANVRISQLCEIVTVTITHFDTKIITKVIIFEIKFSLYGTKLFLKIQ